MIESSFQILERVGKGTEDRLKSDGIKCWGDFLNCKDISGISDKRKHYFDRKIREARVRLYNGDSAYFAKVLPQTEHWRLYDFFKEDACFLDIEVSGVSMHSFVIVVGIFDGYRTKTMIRDVNLDFASLKKELSRYKIFVTFNGSVFDIPFLKRRYPGLIPDIPHVDIRFLCDKVGLTGGLKEVEKKIGIRRNQIVQRLHNGDAKQLWRMFKGSGDDYYLKLLVEYNEEDVLNLQTILEQVKDCLSSSTC